MYAKMFTTFSKSKSVALACMLFFISGMAYANGANAINSCETFDAFVLPIPLAVATDSAECGNSSSTVDVKVDSIGEVTIPNETDLENAKRRYKQALVDKAEAEGQAKCFGPCTLGTCHMRFDDFATNNSLPNAENNGNGGYTFKKPRGGDLAFSIKCDCDVDVKIDIEIDPIKHEEEHGDSQHNLINKEQFGYSFFPNPANSQINLQLNIKESTTAMTLQILDVQGQVVLNQQLGTLSLGQHQVTLSTQDLSPGIYLGSIRSNEQVLASSQIVIQR